MEIIRDNSYRCIYICNKVSGKLQIFQCVYRHILLHNTPAVKPFTLQITCHCIRFCYFFIVPLSAGDDYMYIWVLFQIL